MDIPTDTRKDFTNILSKLPIKSKILEIGTYVGTSIIEMLNILPEASATVIDIWDSYYEHDNTNKTDTVVCKKINTKEIFNNNFINSKINSSRIKVLHGKSINKLLQLLSEHESFNLIYVDSSHKCLDVYFDAVISWKLLKIGGILAFDDYLFNRGDILNSPYEAINHFMNTISNDFIILINNYRLFLKKIN